MSDIKSRNFCMVLYPYEDLNHYAVMDKLESCGYLYCACDHDKDTFTVADEESNPEHIAGTLKKNHTHVVLKFKNPRSKTGLASELGLTDNYIQDCRNVKASLLYLVHHNDETRYQYDFESVYGPLKYELGKYLDDKDEGARVLRILDIIDTMPRNCTYRRLLTVVCERGLYGEFRRMGSGVMRLLDDHNGGLD